MSFTCYPIIITKVEGKATPSSNFVINNLLEDSQIPLNIITDKESNIFKDIKETFNKSFNAEIEYIIVVIKYLKEFKA